MVYGKSVGAIYLQAVSVPALQVRISSRTPFGILCQWTRFGARSLLENLPLT